MVKFKFGFLGFIVASLFGANIAVAGPLAPVGSLTELKIETTQKDVIQVKGCHGKKKWHWVKKWGKKAWHRHGYNCKPHHAKPPKPKVHCHKKWKLHWHKGWGGLWHKHPGQYCGYKKKPVVQYY